MDAIREAGDSHFLSPIKEKLGTSFSYLEIKAVMRHCELLVNRSLQNPGVHR
jgi:hypothetical protein